MRKEYRPVLRITNDDGMELTVWPGLPGISPPALQVDTKDGRPKFVLEFKPKDAPLLAEALLRAARETKK